MERKGSGGHGEERWKGGCGEEGMKRRGWRGGDGEEAKGE